MQDVSVKENMDLSWHENLKMDHDDGGHGYMREEDKKIEFLHKKL